MLNSQSNNNTEQQQKAITPISTQSEYISNRPLDNSDVSSFNSKSNTAAATTPSPTGSYSSSNKLGQISTIVNYLNNNHVQNNNKKGEHYWCWLLKEYFRLGHANSILRIIKFLDQISPYFFISNEILITKSYSNTTSTTSNDNNNIITTPPPIPPHPPLPSSTSTIDNSNNINRYHFYYKSKPVIDEKRSTFPFIYIPNLLRQRSDLFLYFNNKKFSFRNIIYSLSTGNIELLLLPNVKITKSIPIVPFLLIIVYIKLCVSKGEMTRTIIDSLLDCQQKIHLLPQYDSPSIAIDSLLESIMQVTLRFIDWDPESPKQLLPSEVYFNEIFEVIYLTGRDFLDSPKAPPSTPQNKQQQIQIQLQPQPQQQNNVNNSNNRPIEPQPISVTPILVIPSEDYHFKIIDIYLRDSRKIVFFNIRQLAARRNTIHIGLWSEENVNILLNCTLFHLDLFQSTLNDTTSNQEVLMVLDCCMRLAFNWATLVSGILAVNQNKQPLTPQQEQPQTYEITWWNLYPEKLQSMLKLWIAVIQRIFEEITGNNSEKLHLICLVWLASTISLFDSDISSNDQSQLPQLNSYSLFIKTVKSRTDMVHDTFVKSSLLITSFGFALIGVQTIEQTTELIQLLSTLWDIPYNKVILPSPSPMPPSTTSSTTTITTTTNNNEGNNNNINNSNTINNNTTPQPLIVQSKLPPSLENTSLIFKTIQNVFITKFKIENFNSQPEMIQALVVWTKSITEEIYNLFFNSSQNTRFVCMFIGSSIIHAIKRNKSIESLIPLEEKKSIILKIQEIFYTIINQSSYLLKPYRIGLATSYCLSSIDHLQDKNASQSILMLSLDILLDDILGINGSLNEWLNKPSEINNIIIKKMESHKTSPIFLAIPSFIQSISSLINHLKDNDNNRLVLLKICDFTYNLNESWCNFVRESNGNTFPKSSIKKALDPTFLGLFQCLSLIFYDISPVLSPVDSVVGIEMFCQIAFITDDDIPIVNRAVKALVKNVSSSECAITRFIDKLPLAMLMPKDDPISCAKVIVYLHALDSLITSPLIPQKIILDHIVPNLFEYMEYPNTKLNVLVHSILAKIFQIPDFNLTVRMVPKYLTSALQSFPSYTSVSSFYNVLVSIIENNSPTNPIILYAIKTLSLASIQEMKNQQPSSVVLNITSKGLIKILFSLFLFIDVQIIDLVLNEIKNVIKKAPNQKIRLELCSELLSEITGNVDNNSKKNISLSFYLNLIKEVESLNDQQQKNESEDEK